jgi:geranylgeranylglycerol-phosphate geranylgeranyltransferase
LIRVVHPFPSFLDSVAAIAIALIAGSSADIALRLGLGMLAIQFAIGSGNDVADAQADRVAKPAKPIPAGHISAGVAAGVCASAACIGLVAAASVGAGALVVCVLGLADGLLYDLRLKSTPFAWMPFAAGVGLLPLYAWWGARGSVPVAFVGVVAMAVAAGAILALANAWADIEGDRLTGTSSIAVFLGGRWTLLIDGLLLAAVQVIAVATIVMVSGLSTLAAAAVAGCGLSWLGLSLAGIGSVSLRPLVWEVQAIGLAVLGMTWLAALSASGLVKG